MDTQPVDRDAAILRLRALVLRLARWVAKRARSTTVDIDDLESSGWVAAIRAVDAFDPAFGVPLEAYAGRLIVGAMFNELRRADPVSERDRRMVRRGNRLREHLEQELGHEAELRELEVVCPGFRRALARCTSPQISYDGPNVLPDGSILRPIAFLAGATDVARTIVADERRCELETAIATLDERRRAVITQHYFEDRPLRGIATGLDVTPQRVSQMHLSALARLHDRLAPVA